MDAKGAILGARAYSGPRQAIAGGLIGRVVGLFG